MIAFKTVEWARARSGGDLGVPVTDVVLQGKMYA